jgi:hypothetical protein
LPPSNLTKRLIDRIRAENHCDADGRVRGAFVYHGAHTGRFSSRGVQLQNLKRPETEDLGAAIAAVMAGRDLPLSVLGDIARAIITAQPGHRFIAADLSGIESRVVSWLAGEQSKVDLWARFDATKQPEDDPYFKMGKSIFGLPDDTARAIGKTADLSFGYAGGPGAWRTHSPNDARSDEDLRRLQTAWKDAHPRIVGLWRAMEGAALRAIRNPGAVFACGKKLSFRFENEFLMLRLPSGRQLAYPFARIGRNDRDEEVVLYKDARKGFTDCRGGLGMYGGIWVENATQAVARDIFVHGMLELDRAGYPYCLQVHDEICCEVKDDFGSVEEFIWIMTTVPDWADGLPVVAKGRNGPRFAKVTEPALEVQELEQEPPFDIEPEQPEQPETNAHWRDFDFKPYAHKEEDAGGGRVLARYIYEDAGGRPYQRVTKWDNLKCRFSYDHWNGSAWTKGKPPSGPLPYRLPQLIAAAPDEIVAVCEGEKDANTAVDLGFIATTNAGGAGKFTADHARWFTGKKHVIIAEDNDDAGRAHAAKVAAMLHGIVSDIRIASFPELPDHGDLSDWAAQGHTRDELIVRAKPAPAGSGLLELVSAADIAMEGLEWLWPNRFSLGNIAIVAGLPDQGKGQLCYDIAARVTTGAAWPCGEGEAPLGNVLLLNAEDGLADTVIPRLEAAGADRSRIKLIKGTLEPKQAKPKRMFSLISDLELLRRAAIDMGDVKLIEIDPISAYLGIKQIDSFRTSDVRAVLSPLFELSCELRAAIIAVMHFNKKIDVNNALLRISDSLAYGAAARHVYVATYDETNDIGLFTKAKNNLATRSQKSLTYKFDTRTVGTDTKTGAAIVAPHIVWTGHTDVTASEALNAINANKSPRERDNAKEFLNDLLSNGPVLADDIKEAAKADGISVATLRRAQRDLKIKSKKDGPPKNGEATWQWHLPGLPT